MNKTETQLEYKFCENQEKGLPVIIVAAGSSKRMLGTNKQLMNLAGIPVIIRTLSAFEQSNYINRIILVTKSEDIFLLQNLANKYNISKLSDIICGGKTRALSVLKGIERLEKDDSSVLIHDGARPFVTEDIIYNVIKGLESYPSVTCCVEITNTVKQVAQDGVVIKTLDRSCLRSIQTPQAVKVKEYCDAVSRLGDVSNFTDDVSIMEMTGYKVLCVEGSYKNIKITTPSDISVAESYLKEEN